MTNTTETALNETLAPTPKKKGRPAMTEEQKTAKEAEKTAAKAAAKAMADEAKRIAEATKAKAKADAEAAAAERQIDGFELKEGADVETVKMFAGNALAALSEITKADRILVGHYLAFGEFQSKVAPMFKSTKIYGQFLAEKLPASSSLDPALRSNCKWLFENLGPVCRTLGVNQIEDYEPSANPSVIRKHYKAITDKAAVEAAAEEAGVSPEELEAEEKAAADKAAADEAQEIADAIRALSASIHNASTKAKAAEGVASIMTTLMTSKNRKEMVTTFLSFFDKTDAE
jgi:hypothetical protein